VWVSGFLCGGIDKILSVCYARR